MKAEVGVGGVTVTDARILSASMPEVPEELNNMAVAEVAEDADGVKIVGPTEAEDASTERDGGKVLLLPFGTFHWFADLFGIVQTQKFRPHPKMYACMNGLLLFGHHPFSESPFSLSSLVSTVARSSSFRSLPSPLSLNSFIFTAQ